MLTKVGATIGFGAVVACVVVVSVVALVLAMVDAGRNVYGGGAVTTGEFLIWLSSSSLSLSDSLADTSDGAFSGSSKGGNSSSTGDGSLVSLRTSSRS